jgi:hypothetical protein
MSTLAEAPPESFPVDPLDEFAILTSEYESARLSVLATAQAYTDAVERCADIRIEYVQTYSFLLKDGADLPPRIQGGILPGGTSQDGLRERKRATDQRRW